jgi:hypothetical protein
MVAIQSFPSLAQPWRRVQSFAQRLALSVAAMARLEARGSELAAMAYLSLLQEPFDRSLPRPRKSRARQFPTMFF